MGLKTFALGGGYYEDEAKAAIAAFPTPNSLLALELAESGQISWKGLYGLLQKALGAANIAAQEGLAA